MTAVIRLSRGSARRPEAMSRAHRPLDMQAIRGHFTFPELGRVVTNNAASTQPPRELVALHRRSRPGTRTCTAGSPRASQR